jgi:hypothetical protein
VAAFRGGARKMGMIFGKIDVAQVTSHVLEVGSVLWEEAE